MLDADGDARDGEVNQMFSVPGMREVLLEHNADLPATSAFARDLRNVPIDGCFAAPMIQPQAGGHLAFGAGPGLDHWRLWLDISCPFDGKATMIVFHPSQEELNQER